MAYVRLFTIYITACYIQSKGHAYLGFLPRTRADVILHPDINTGSTQRLALALALHARVGMGGSMLARTWHEFISRLLTYSKYQGLVSAMELISKVDTRLCTLYIDDLAPYAQYTIQLLGMW